MATIAISVARSGLLIRKSYTSVADPGFKADPGFEAHGACRASGAAVGAAEAALGDAPATAGNAAEALPAESAAEVFAPPANMYSTS